MIDNAFDWGDDKRLGIPLHSSIIYEVHVKGFTKLCPDVPLELRGTSYAVSTICSDEPLTTVPSLFLRLIPRSWSERADEVCIVGAFEAS